MKITVLAENTAVSPDYGAEHGLSLFIETDNHKILFDMGQTALFADNADKLGITLADVDFAVLSHGHYDHGGGLEKFLEINQTAPVYLSKYAFEPHYNGNEKYIGLDVSLSQNPRFVYTDEETKISNNLILFSCNSKKKNYALIDSGLNMIQHEEFLPDDFRHEHYLLINENGKRILISGCSHKGILNITEWFNPDVIIGGFHFSKLPLDKNLENYAKHLNRFNTDFYTCHCTGIEQYEFMKKFMNRLDYLPSGSSITI